MHALIMYLKSPVVRRNLIAAYLILVILLVSFYVHRLVTKDPIMKIQIRGEEWLGFDEAADLAKRFDRMVDRIDASDWSAGKATDENMTDWAYEITPMFTYEGLVTEGNATFDFFTNPFFDGYNHNHIAGRSDCATYVLLNARYKNKFSGWYQKNLWPVVLAHEIAHAQQGASCDREYNTQDNIENSAQIMAWEVMAAVANQGSKEAVLSMAYELRASALSAAAAMAGFEDRQDDYDSLIDDIFEGDAHETARRAKGMRFWSSDLEQLEALRMRYSWTPLNLVFEARNEGTIYQLSVSNDTHSADIDDLLYFIEHMEELVDWAIGGK